MSKQLINNVACVIKKLRKTQNLSQEELAGKAGLDRTYISGVERGVRNITLDSLESIIIALDISVCSFIGELKENLDEKGADLGE